MLLALKPMLIAQVVGLLLMFALLPVMFKQTAGNKRWLFLGVAFANLILGAVSDYSHRAIQHDITARRAALNQDLQSMAERVKEAKVEWANTTDVSKRSLLLKRFKTMSDELDDDQKRLDEIRKLGAQL